MASRKALVRRPGPRLPEGIVAHIERVPVDYELAVKQWEQYVAVLRRYDWETIEVARAEDCPDSVFVEDTVVVYERPACLGSTCFPCTNIRERLKLRGVDKRLI